MEGSEESMDSIPEQGSEEGELQQKQEEEMDETAKVEEEEDAELEIGVTDMESEVFGITSDMALDSDMDKSETESFIMQDVGDVPEIEETMTMLSERVSWGVGEFALAPVHQHSNSLLAENVGVVSLSGSPQRELWESGLGGRGGKASELTASCIHPMLMLFLPKEPLGGL